MILQFTLLIYKYIIKQNSKKKTKKNSTNCSIKIFDYKTLSTNNIINLKNWVCVNKKDDWKN